MMGLRGKRVLSAIKTPLHSLSLLAAGTPRRTSEKVVKLKAKPWWGHRADAVKQHEVESEVDSTNFFLSVAAKAGLPGFRQKAVVKLALHSYQNFKICDSSLPKFRTSER